MEVGLAEAPPEADLLNRLVSCDINTTMEIRREQWAGRWACRVTADRVRRLRGRRRRLNNEQDVCAPFDPSATAALVRTIRQATGRG
eukprot:4592698-Pyramimonas_sp.AAC.1